MFPGAEDRSQSKLLGNVYPALNTAPANKGQSHHNSSTQIETIIWAVSCVPVSAGSGSGSGLLPHVEHHTHHTVVSGGAGESLSSAPWGIRPGAENWDFTVRAMTSCSAHSSSSWNSFCFSLTPCSMTTLFFPGVSLPYVQRAGQPLAALQFCLYLVISTVGDII